LKFSITIPSFKTLYLKEAIESIISQTYPDWELVIVDDCSPEDIAGVVKPYLADHRVRYYRNEKNCGAENVVDNWNICLNYCTGDYVICIGDDDRLLPCCLEEYGKLIEKYPNLNVYHARTEIIDERGLVAEKTATRPEREDVLTMMTERWNGRNQFIGDFCYKREHLVSQGGYYVLPFAWGSDDITAFRAALTDGIANTEKAGFQYRENRNSISLSYNDREKADAVMLQKKWYISIIKKLQTGNICSEDMLLKAKQSMRVYLKDLIVHHVYRDIKRGGMESYMFWVDNRSNYGVSFLALTIMYLKSLVLQWIKN